MWSSLGFRHIAGPFRFESDNFYTLFQAVATAGVEDLWGLMFMVKQEHASFRDSVSHWKKVILRLHSRARAVMKNAKRRLFHGKALRFHRAFIKEGDLVFDVGANVGEMTALYLEIGARVVSVEPQEECVRILEDRFRKHPSVTVVPMAVGAGVGKQELMLSDIRSPISSMSREWIAAVKFSGRFPYYEWSRSVTVPVTTLDSLINRYGEPDFCKIDVEGLEKEVLKGVSRPLSCLSFEFHAECLPDAFACLDLLRALCGYSFNFTIENRMVFESPRWLDADGIFNQLRSLPYSSLQGDVYARRQD